MTLLKYISVSFLSALLSFSAVGFADDYSGEEIWNLVQPGLAKIEVRAISYENARPIEYSSEGSGFIFRVEPAENRVYVVTNYHVIQNATSVRTRFLANDFETAANVVGYDAQIDIAALEVVLPGATIDDLRLLKWGASNEKGVGSSIIAIGGTKDTDARWKTGSISTLDR